MSEQIYTYRDPSFNLNQAYYHTLLVQIGPVSFSYAVVYKKQLVALGTNYSLTQLTDPQELADELTATYKKVIIGLPANGFSLIPNAIFNKEHIKDYARLLNVRPDEKVLVQRLDDENYIIYKADEKITSAAEKFGLNNTVYVNKGWITVVAESNPQDLDLYLHIENGKATFLNFQGGKIRFYNQFDFVTADDLTYFTAFVTRELGLDQNDVQLKISGDIQPGYSNHLAAFFPNTATNDLKVLELPSQIPLQQVLTLAALSLCVSSEER